MNTSTNITLDYCPFLIGCNCMVLPLGGSELPNGLTGAVNENLVLKHNCQSWLLNHQKLQNGSRFPWWIWASLRPRLSRSSEVMESLTDCVLLLLYAHQHHLLQAPPDISDFSGSSVSQSFENKTPAAMQPLKQLPVYLLCPKHTVAPHKPLQGTWTKSHWNYYVLYFLLYYFITNLNYSQYAINVIKSIFFGGTQFFSLLHACQFPWRQHGLIVKKAGPLRLLV